MAPEFVLNKFYPKFINQELSVEKIHSINFEPDREIHIKVTRRTDYGDRYKLFVIDKNSFEQNFNLNTYGISLGEEEGNLTVKKLDWKGLAKNSGIEIGDIISNFKVLNYDRPSKNIIYPFSFLLLLIFGYSNYKRKQR